MAGIGAAKKVDKFISIIGASIGLATTTFVSQNLGANRPERSFGAIRRALMLCFVTWLVMALPLMLTPAFFIRLFTQDGEAVSYGVDMMRVMVPLYFCLSVNQVYANAVRGFGYSRAVMVLSLIGMVGVRQLFLIISMSIRYSVLNVYLAYPVGWVFAGIPVFIFYLIVIRGKKEYSFRAIRELEKDAEENE